MLMWLLKKHKQKKLSKLPRKRRIFEHQAEPLVDELYMKHQIRTYEIKYAKLGKEAPEHLSGCEVEILFYGKLQCEVKLLNEEKIPSFYILTEKIDFSPIQPTTPNSIAEGEFVELLSDIKSDDELKGILGEESDELLIIKVEREAEFSYWAYNEETKEAFRVKENEVKRLNKRIEVEIV